MKDLTTPAIDAVNTLLGDGVPDDLTQRILELSIEAMHMHHERQQSESRNNRGAERTECDIGENGWLNEGWAAWRLTLPMGDNPAVIYFTKEPSYAQCVAFSRAAGVRVDQAVVEGRE